MTVLTRAEPEDLIELARQRLRERVARTLPLGTWKAAAVLLLLYGPAGDERIILTVRSNDVEYHKGQISLPGGSVDADDRDLAATALRETEEEVGIARAEIEVLGRLDDRITVSDFRVSPIVGTIPQARMRFNPSPLEVAEVLEVPLRHLLDRANRCDELHVRNGRTEVRPGFNFGAHRIWGATARIVADLVDLLVDSRPASNLEEERL
jgi:8-oxo-dGTP pyrophosphatase MutT (NUDIX family)